MEILEVIPVWIGAILIAIGGILAFFGSKIFHAVIFLLGGILLGGILATATYVVSGNLGVAILLGIIGFVVGGVIALMAYYIVLFIIGAIIGLLLAMYLFPDNSSTQGIFAVVFGAIFIIIFEFLIILATAIQGGSTVSLGVLILGGGFGAAAGVGILVMVVGFLFQLGAFPSPERARERTRLEDSASLRNIEREIAEEEKKTEKLKEELLIDDKNAPKHLELAELVHPHTKGISPRIEKESFKESELHYNKAIELEPSNAKAHFGLASLYSLHGRRYLAVKGFRKVLDLNPDYPEARQELARMLSGSDKRESLREASKLYELVLEGTASNPGIALERARVLKKLGDLDGYSEICKTYFPSFDPYLHEIERIHVHGEGSGCRLIDKVSGRQLDKKMF